MESHPTPLLAQHDPDQPGAKTLHVAIVIDKRGRKLA